MTGQPGGYGDADMFWRGVDAGQFPAAQGPDGTISAVVTDGKSRWLGTRCGTCNQTFRLGDRVRLAADGAVGHLDPALGCWLADLAEPAGGERPLLERGQDPPDSPAGADSGDFTEGLLSAWPPAREAPVFRLSRGDWRVTTPRSGPTSPACPGCGHTFRAGDMVVICPCAGAVGDPRREYCQIAVHRDPARGLCCWDDWAPDGRLRRCPRTFARVSW
jgi:hypothetical protein